jgi:hypothetical protein
MPPSNAPGAGGCHVAKVPLATLTVLNVPLAAGLTSGGRREGALRDIANVAREC